MQPTVLRAIGKCFPNKCANIQPRAISFGQYEFPFTPAGAPATLGAQTPGLSPSIHSAPLSTLLLEKRRLSIACPNTRQLTRGLIFKGLSKKASKRCQTAGDAVSSDLKLDPVHSSAKACCSSLDLNTVPIGFKLTLKPGFRNT